MKMTKIVSLLLALFLLAGALPMAFAEETEPTEETVEETQPELTRETSGVCGDNLTWELKDRVLTISGSGEMEEGSPWGFHAKGIDKVVLRGGVTTVAPYAFEGYENLEAVDFGDSLVEIGEAAFRGCKKLEAITLPKTFRRFLARCFYGCEALDNVYCLGGMPSFRDACFWKEGVVSVYYPVNNPWPAEEVTRLTNGFGGHLYVYPSSEMEGADWEAVAAAATEPEETVPETTEATAPTVVTLPPETVPVVTVPETIPETAPAVVETEPEETVVYTLPTMATVPAQEAEPEEEGIGGAIIAVALIGGVLTFFILGALIARLTRNKGGRYYQ